MTKSTIIFGLGGLLVGCVTGFIAGYYASKKKSDDEINYILSNKKNDEEAPAPTTKVENNSEETKENKKESFDPSRIISPGPAKIAMPGQDGINYTAYAKKVEELNYKAESEAPKDSDEDEETYAENKDGEALNKDDFTQTYEDRVIEDNIEITKEFEIYKKKHKKDFYILRNGVDPEWPDITFTKETLFYFTMDDVLTDEDGKFVDEKDLIGLDLRKFGWFINKDMTETTVRNMKYERDYDIIKEFTSYDDFFPDKANDPMDEENEEDE